MVLDSSNRAANVLIDHAGGSWAINDLMTRLGATSTDMYGHYLLEPGERAEPDEPDAGFADGWWPDGPLPTAREARGAAGRRLLAALLRHRQAHDGTRPRPARDGVVQATTGRGRLARLGVTRREARVGIWLLLHARYPGLFAPATGSPVAHKAGWLTASSTIRRSSTGRPARS